MRSVKRLGQSTVRPMVLALAAGAFAIWRAFVGDPFTDALEDRALDLRFQLRGEVEPPDELLIVAFDEAAVDRFGWSPPPREAVAAAIEAILDGGARSVALDMLFVDPGPEDEQLAAALEDGPPVILAAANTRGTGTAASDQLESALDRSAFARVVDAPPLRPVPGRLLAPVDALLRDVRLAHVNLARSPDGSARRVPLYIRVEGDRYLPALSLETARIMNGVPHGQMVLRPGRDAAIGDIVIATDSDGMVQINHYGDAGTIPSVGVLDILDQRVPNSIFDGRSVVMGVTDESFSDLFATPFSPRVPGVEVMATIAGNLSQGEALVHTGPARAASLLAAPALAFAVALTAGIASLPLAVVTAGLAWIAGLVIIHLPFIHADLTLDAVSVIFALVIATGASALRWFSQTRRMNLSLDRERANLSRYVSPRLADELARQAVPGFDRRVQSGAILFADLVGFTTIAERMTAEDVAALMRGLHRFYERCAERHGAVIISFEGDGVMMAFGLPEPAADDPIRALNCGRELAEGMAWPTDAAGSGRLRLRVSANYGPVSAAVVGGDRHSHVTMSGDTVNVASRLQDVAKANGAQFVVSRALLDAAAEGGATERYLAGTEIGLISLRGRDTAVEAWSL